MRGPLLKCSGEQVRRATDSECLGAELAKVLSQELMKSRERPGQRGFVDVEAEGKPEQGDVMGVDHDPGGIPSGPAYTPGAASSSGGTVRMPTIPEERPERSGIP